MSVKEKNGKAKESMRNGSLGSDIAPKQLHREGCGAFSLAKSKFACCRTGTTQHFGHSETEENAPPKLSVTAITTNTANSITRYGQVLDFIRSK